MLFLICTPIGNLNDFSLRSIITLQEADKIYAEDTRAAAKLFKNETLNPPFEANQYIKATLVD